VLISKNKNMKKCVKFPSIEQFRTVISNINRQVGFVGLDDNGDAIYDVNQPKPILTFTTTVKLHGSNFGCSLNNIDGLWFQSRENVITPEHDNYGAAFAGTANKATWLELINKVVNDNSIDLDKNTVTIYGEWVGKGVQKNVGISNLEKSVFIFGVKVSPFENPELEKQLSAYWVESKDLRSPEHRIYNILDYESHSIEIDFNYPKLIQNKLVEMTIAVEDECPVSKAFGFPNTLGEGIVLTTTYKGVRHLIKCKGEKHSSSKVKTVASVDIEKIDNIKEFVDYAVTESRFNQSIENVFPNNEPIDIKKLGDVIRWVINDIIKEETDTMFENGLEPKEINKYVSTKVREMFFKLSV
jgi:hypothetical protein